MSQATEVITAITIEPTPEALIVNLGNRAFRIPWGRCSPRLAQASTTQRLAAELSPGGYGINWPLLDEDVSIAGLLRSGGAG
jgi:Protein of unknown function (DUF2442)